MPVYFVPLDGKKPLVKKAVELWKRDANELWRHRTGFEVSDKWVVSASGSLFEVATGEFHTQVAESGVTDEIATDWIVRVKK